MYNIKVQSDYLVRFSVGFCVPCCYCMKCVLCLFCLKYDQLVASTNKWQSNKELVENVPSLLSICTERRHKNA